MAPHPVPSGTAAGSPARVPLLIIERDPMARRGLAIALGTTSDLAISATESTIEAATYLRASLPVDVVVVGDDVIDMDGTGGILRLLSRFLAARVIVLVSEAVPARVVGVLRQGADGVLPRDTPPEELIHAVRGVMNGKVALPQEWIRFLTDALRLGPLTSAIDEARLSPREREVLREIGRGRSNAAIARCLGLRESTVKTHVSNILLKTGVRSRHALWAARPAVGWPA